MLVLTRQKNETIVINGGTPDEIRLYVIGIRGDRTRIGVEAPRHVTVHRGEIQLKIDREREADGKATEPIRCPSCDNASGQPQAQPDATKCSPCRKQATPGVTERPSVEAPSIPWADGRYAT